MTTSVLRFLDHTQRRTTVGRTPLDEWSVRRAQHSEQTSMLPVGIDPTTPAGERTQTYAVDRAVAGTGCGFIYGHQTKEKKALSCNFQIIQPPVDPLLRISTLGGCCPVTVPLHTQFPLIWQILSKQLQESYHNPGDQLPGSIPQQFLSELWQEQCHWAGVLSDCLDFCLPPVLSVFIFQSWRYAVLCDMWFYVVLCNIMWYDVILCDMWYYVILCEVWYVILCDMWFYVIYNIMWCVILCDIVCYVILCDMCYYVILCDMWYYAILCNIS